MQSLDLNVSNNNLLTTPTSLPFPSATAMATAMDNIANNPGSTTPPDFDFNIPCRYFKSSFARSLSLNNPSHHFQCKSLDYDINNMRNYNNNNNNNNNANGIGNNFHNCRNDSVKNMDAPPLPQRMSRAGTPPTTATKPTTTQITTAAMSISGNINISINAKNEVSSSDESCCSNNNLPPALPARRPMPATNSNINNSNNNNNSSCSSNGSIGELQPQHKQQQLPLLTQLKQQQQNKNNNNNSNGIANANGIGNSYANDSDCGSGSGSGSSSGCANINSNGNNANSGGNVSSVIHGNFNKLTINHALQQQQHKEHSIDHNIRRNVWPKDNVEQCIPNDRYNHKIVANSLALVEASNNSVAAAAALAGAFPVVATAAAAT
ncbi:putative uncharacterized protein DDB_G0285119 [Teleopsis dalmanni]|uniref:putative uncharacterized protein DDB_G0285119 n=1 Tax=Teleopsis dalmanni TaxID=139649 RepID=UPI0018CE3127|nr:putative uncharacterized protein DDB_G0285119 [Teleopsis dalmanni]